MINEIPLEPKPQTFGISLSGVAYRLTLIWRNVDQGGWFMDIADSNNKPLVQGIPLVTGVNLLSPFPYLNILGGLYVQTDNAPDNVPTFTNLGTQAHLYYVT